MAFNTKAIRMEVNRKPEQASTLYYNILCDGILYAERNKSRSGSRLFLQVNCQNLYIIRLQRF